MIKKPPNGNHRFQGNTGLGIPALHSGFYCSSYGHGSGSIFHLSGLTLLKEKIEAKVAPHTNPAIPMKMPFGPKGFQDFDWPMPNLLMGNIPGFETVATSLMKKTLKNKGVATIEELRSICLDSGVNLIGCQMTMDVFGFSKDEFIEGVNIGGAATFLEFAMDADIQLFI